MTATFARATGKIEETERLTFLHEASFEGLVCQRLPTSRYGDVLNLEISFG